MPRRRTSVLGAIGTALAVSLLLATPAQAVIPGQEPAGPPPRVEPDVREYVLPATAVQPESVVYDARSRSFYTSSSNGGSITKVTYPQGQATVFTPPAVEGSEANGLALDNRNRIYVARGTNSRVDVYDLTTRQRVGRFTTPPGSFVNDLTVDRRTGDVYATDSFLPAIYRISGAQVAAGTGTPQTIPTAPEVTTAPVGTNPPKPFNANGIRFTPDGRYLLFDDLNDAALYRMTVPPANAPAQRQITRVAVTGGSLGDADGLEFDGRTLYVVDNGGERILNLSLSNDWTRATITKATTSPLYRTPTSAALTPDGRLLVSQAELFDTNGPPYAVTSQPRP